MRRVFRRTSSLRRDQRGGALGDLLEGFGLSRDIAYSCDLKPAGHMDPL